MQTLSAHVLHTIRERALLRAGDRVGVAVSGGADSVALLRLLLELRGELGIVLTVVHLNHGTRGAESDADAQFVAALAAEHDLELHAERADAPAFARARKLSLEAAGRALRHALFVQLMSAGKLTRVATAHTADDQAETVLLRLLRGAGTRGLAGIWPARELEDCVDAGDLARAGASAGESPASTQANPAEGGRGPTSLGVIRPLLGVRRAELRAYLRELGQEWREDASNLDRKHLRNRVRHELLPLLERDYNLGIVAVLAGTAEVARAEEEWWQEQVDRLLGRDAACRASETWQATSLHGLPLALQRRVVRALAEAQHIHLDFEHVEQALHALRAGGSKTIELPGGARALVSAKELCFDGERPTQEPKIDYEVALAVPGEVEIRQLGRRIKAFLVPDGAEPEGYNREQFLDRQQLGKHLTVRNWRPGDRFWPAHTKAPKKVKQLLAERRIALPERALWPVAVSGGEIVWLRGFATAREFAARRGGEAVGIAEEPIENF